MSLGTNNHFEDLPKIDSAAYENPYDALINAASSKAALIQAYYSKHRITRNEQQKAKLLSSDFSGLAVDPILLRLTDPINPGAPDPRHGIVFWARPPSHIRALASEIQQKLLTLAPKLWLAPPDMMHLTVCEIIHSITHEGVKRLLAEMGETNIAAMTDYTYDHRARLVKPLVSYDNSALALSFVPAAGVESAQGAFKDGSKVHDDSYTHHHLRRDLFNMAKTTGVHMEPRYVAQTAHITVARFVSQDDLDTPEKMRLFIKMVEEINESLKRDYWPEDEAPGSAGEWVIGHEKGLDCREGAVWYGGGETAKLGKGFENPYER